MESILVALYGPIGLDTVLGTKIASSREGVTVSATFVSFVIIHLYRVYIIFYLLYRFLIFRCFISACLYRL